MVGLAVKVTVAPAQIAPGGLADTLTDGVTLGVMAIVMLPDVAVVGEAHKALLVNTQVTTAPLASEVLL